MTVTLTCLGGAAAWPNPGQGCSSYLVNQRDQTILIDCGPNTLLELRKHTRYSKIGAVFISHMHSDHILDLIPYRYGLVYGPERPSEPIPLYLPPGGIETLEALGTALGSVGEAPGDFWTQAFSVEEYDPATGKMIDSIEVEFARTDHAAPCFAMRFRFPDSRTLAYTADTGSIESVLEFARDSDILIAEATSPESAQERGAGHLKPSEAGRLATLAQAQQLVLTHLWAERPDAEVIAAAVAHYDGTINVAKPGLVISV